MIKNITSNVAIQAGQVLSNGILTSANFKTHHVFGTNAEYFNIVYQNGSPNPINIRVGVKYNNQIYPIYFNGSRDIQIPAGGQINSDYINLSVTAFSTAYVITYISVNPGQKWSCDYNAQFAYGEGFDTSNIDKTLVDGIPAKVGVMYGPSAIVSDVNTPFQSFYYMGDSILKGVGDKTAMGFMGYKHWDGDHIPAIRGGWSGDKAFVFAKKSLRFQLIPYCTRVVFEYGTNDLNSTKTLAQLQASYLSIWTEILGYGVEIEQTGILPRVKTIDRGITLEGQTVVLKNWMNGVREGMNNWFETLPGGIIAFRKTHLALQDPSNSQKFKINTSADGTHPNQTGHILMGAV